MAYASIEIYQYKLMNSVRGFVDLACGTSIITYVLLGPQIRFLPVTITVLLVAPFWVWLLVNNGLVEVQKSPALLLTFLAVIYIILSYFHVFGSSWTIYYDRNVIIQQASFVGILYPISEWARVANTRYEGSNTLRYYIYVILFVGVVAYPSFAGFVVYGSPNNKLEQPFSTIHGNVVILIWAWAYITFVMRLVFMPLLILLTFLATSLFVEVYIQTLVMQAIMGGSLLFWRLRVFPTRLVAGLSVLIVLGVSGIVMIYAEEVLRIDPNSGWRGLFWRDAFYAAWDTWLVGVGFGTEAVRAGYSLTTFQVFTGIEDATSFLLIGAHSAFADAALRLGGGGVTLLVILVAHGFPDKDLDRSSAWADSVTFCALLFCIALNVGLQSPPYSVGAALAIGWLRAENQRVKLRRCGHRA